MSSPFRFPFAGTDFDYPFAASGAGGPLPAGAGGRYTFREATVELPDPHAQAMRELAPEQRKSPFNVAVKTKEIKDRRAHKQRIAAAQAARAAGIQAGIALPMGPLAAVPPIVAADAVRKLAAKGVRTKVKKEDKQAAALQKIRDSAQ